jgi:Flp pilus assembly protein TadG
VLVQIALMVFVVCGLLSLVVDVGYARLTQGQMQNAADAAALEGLGKTTTSIRRTGTLITISERVRLSI